MDTTKKLRTNHERLKKEIKGYIGSFGGIIMRKKTIGEIIEELKKFNPNGFVEGYEGEDVGLNIMDESGVPIGFISTKVGVRKWTEKDLEEKVIS